MSSVRTRMKAGPPKVSKELGDQYGLISDTCPWSECFPGLVPFRQFPVDVNHSELKGMCSRYLNLLLEGVLTTSGQKAFRDALANFQNPPHWQPFQNPITHRKSYGFTELGRLITLIPYLIERAIQKINIKPGSYDILFELARKRDRAGSASQHTQYGLDCLIQVYARLADHVVMCLKSSYRESEIRAVEKSSIEVCIRVLSSLAQTSRFERLFSNWSGVMTRGLSKTMTWRHELLIH